MEKRLNESITCASGFTMSVQAHVGAYCTPRISDAPKYSEVEVGFPSEREPLLMDWCEDPHDPTGTVYGYVPAGIVTIVIAKHGGMVSGKAPPGVVELWAESD